MNGGACWCSDSVPSTVTVNAFTVTKACHVGEVEPASNTRAGESKETQCLLAHTVTAVATATFSDKSSSGAGGQRRENRSSTELYEDITEFYHFKFYYST